MGNTTSVSSTLNADSSLKGRVASCVTEDGRIDYAKLHELKKTWELTECKIAIIGMSGSGKSTLINNLLGVPKKSEAEQYV